MVHIHLKDVAIGGDQSRSWACIGAGNGQYPALFQALAESGYTGSVALETHWKSSDNNPETASRACLAVMQQLLG
jgi:sugar phosphate isomerase/epimerase